MRSNEQIANYLSIAGVETDATEFSCLYHAIDERNAETGEMEVTEEGFIIYATDEARYD